MNVLDDTTVVQGVIRISSSDFTRMPKGFLSFHVDSYSEFRTETEDSQPENPVIATCKDLVLRVSKVVDQEGE